MERVRAVHTATKANKGMAGNVGENDFDPPGYKPQQSLKSVVKRPSDIGSDIERVLADLPVLTEANV